MPDRSISEHVSSPINGICKKRPERKDSLVQGKGQNLDIPLKNRFQILLDLVVDNDADNALESNITSMYTGNSSPRKRIREHNGEHNGRHHAGDFTDIS